MRGIASNLVRIQWQCAYLVLLVFPRRFSKSSAEPRPALIWLRLKFERLRGRRAVGLSWDEHIKVGANFPVSLPERRPFVLLPSLLHLVFAAARLTMHGWMA